MRSYKNKIILDKLNIQNFATFNSQTISFICGFNAIVGETGSGKSLLLEALQMIFGGRADKKMVRQGAKFAVIEATFSTTEQSILDYFDDFGHPALENEIVIKRIVYENGKSKSYLNHQSTTLSTLTKITRRFVDLVGQFENQKLLSNKYQLILLDSFSKNMDKLKNFSEKYQELVQLQNKISELQKNQLEFEQKKDYIIFQLSEISKLNPSEEDEEELITKKNELITIQSELESIILANNFLSECDSGASALEQLKKALKIVENSNNNSISSQASMLQLALEKIEDVSYTLSKFTEGELDQATLEETIDRLDKYQTLKRKFGGTTESIIDYYNSFKKELDSISSIDGELETSIAKQSSLRNEAVKLAEQIHESRITNAVKLSTLLTKSVQKLRMKGAQIELVVRKNNELGPTGISSIEFMAQTNPGEGSHKLSSIASGGELSRILLSMRQILSVHDSISVFLFDEIDTGIGGQTALTIGKVLRDVSKDSQVIAITHLPQIAINADKLIEVTKSSTTKNNNNIRTESIVNEHIGIKVKEHAEFMASL